MSMAIRIFVYHWYTKYCRLYIFGFKASRPCVPFVHQNPPKSLYRQLNSTFNVVFLCTICVPKSCKLALELVLRSFKFYRFVFRSGVFPSWSYQHGTQMNVLIHLCTMPFLSLGTQMVHKNIFFEHFLRSFLSTHIHTDIHYITTKSHSNHMTWVAYTLTYQFQVHLSHDKWLCYGLWSRWRDSNPRPLRPERSALPNWATPRNIGLTITQLSTLLGRGRRIWTLGTRFWS